MIPDYPYQQYPQKREKLKPEGHSAWIESLIEPAIVVASTLMSIIAVYVLAFDEIQHILNGTSTLSDWFVTALCLGLGFLVDMAIIVSATRYKMHMVRRDPRENTWKYLALAVLIVGIVSEGLTLFYFVVSLSPSHYPAAFTLWANRIHGFLGISRAFLPITIVAYFAAGILPVMVDRGDRNRKIISITSNNIMVLIDMLSQVYRTDDKSEQLRALAGQMALSTYAEYDRTDRTDEPTQMRRDSKLLDILARIHGLDWSAIGADVAPELVARTVDAEDFPPLPPTPPEPPTRTRSDTRMRESVAEDFPAAPSLRALPARAASSNRASGKVSREEKRKHHAFAIIAANPAISPEELRKTMRCRWELADKWIREYRRTRAKSAVGAE